MPIQFEEGMSAYTSRMVNTPQGWKEVKEYSTRGTTTNGIATFQLTDTGTNAGNAVFKSIMTIQPTPMINASIPAEVPRCSARALSADRKVLTVQVAQGSPAITVVGIQVAGLEKWVQDGTVVYLTVTGE
ncbi:hypothetical protein [Paenibacillus kandeliae]|uniref:hypothetical protein n=1 Tax=Paenibacillus kandeliae TaxID=3231269 RepID=UPI00345A61BE